MNRFLIIFLMVVGAPLGLALFILSNLFLAPAPGPASNIQYGFTWSKPYAESLGLNSQEGLEATLAELNMRHVRLPVYWTETEREEGAYNWTSVQEQVDLVKKYNGSVTLILGAKQVRWPECWIPSWVSERSPEEQKQKERAYLEAAYQAFQDESAVTRWQIQNEPSFSFGDCPEIDKNFVMQELAAVRSWEEQRRERGQTKRPVVTTDAGEWATWLDFAGKTDALGISLYRTVLTPAPEHARVDYWFIGPGFYAVRARWLRPLIGPVYLSELQMEPWAPQAISASSPNEHFATFLPEDLERTFRFANATGFPEINFWGTEWWYFMKTKRNQPEYWDAMKRLLSRP